MSLAGLFQVGPALVARISNFDKCLETGMGRRLLKVSHVGRTGRGLTYDGEGSYDIAKGIERMHWQAFKHTVPENLISSKHLDGGKWPKLLEKGNIYVAEVGCGTGVLLVELAKRFPNSQFHGYELSTQAVSEAEKNILISRLNNVQIFNVADTPMPNAFYDMCICYDVIHDCAKPKVLMKQVG